jgi:hypothetical protein
MVHPTYSLFLALYLAYSLAGFAFQTDTGTAARKRARSLHYTLHALLQYSSSLFVVAIMNPALAGTWKFQCVVIGLCGIQVIFDWAKRVATSAGWIPGNIWSYVAEQFIHILTVLLATFVILRPPWNSVVPFLEKIRSQQDKILLVAVIYFVVIFGGGYFIRLLIRPLWKEKPGEHNQEHEEVVNAGLYIGWLERFLALTAIFLQSPGTVGLILTAKSIARYPELKSPGRFVEYFLIGTLLSLSIAILGGILLLKVFYGTVSLGK